MFRPRNTFIMAGFVGCVGLALYPIVFAPMMNSSQWKKVQRETRKGVDQKSIQPGGMRVWSDPFKPRADSK